MTGDFSGDFGGVPVSRPRKLIALVKKLFELKYSVYLLAAVLMIVVGGGIYLTASHHSATPRNALSAAGSSSGGQNTTGQPVSGNKTSANASSSHTSKSGAITMKGKSGTLSSGISNTYSGGSSSGSGDGSPGGSSSGSDDSGGSSGGGSASVTPHIMVIMMENEGENQIIGNGSLPYINNTLAQNYPLLRDSYATAHPSLPNYLELSSGSVWGVTTDCAPGSGCEGSDNLAHQLDDAGISWAGYFENLPYDGYTGGDTGGDDGYGDEMYAQHHNPFVYYPDLAGELATHVKQYSELIGDLNSSSPPAFVWVTPNMLDDMHDGPLSTGDTWLSNQIPAIQATNWYKSGGQILITWDEALDSDTSGLGGGSGGQIPGIFISQAEYQKPDYTTPVDHAGILRSIEQAYSLPLLNDAANSANGSLSLIQ